MTVRLGGHTGRNRLTWRPVAAVFAALVAVGFALSLPQPVSIVDGPASVPAAPRRLHDVWPSATPSVLPSTVRDGYTYQPFLVVDPMTSVGLATSPDFTIVRLVVLTDASERALRTLAGADPPTVAAVTTIGTDVYWLETGQDSAGRRHTELWRAGLAGGRAHRIAADASDVLYYDSAYDLQVVNGVAHWAASVVGGPGGEIHSVPVDGGRRTVARFDRLYALTQWPWATSTGDGQPGPADLVNLETGKHLTVAGGANEILNCVPSWCRITTLINQGQSLTVDIQRIDGAAGGGKGGGMGNGNGSDADDRQRVGNAALTPLNTDVALRGRFEVLADAGTTNAVGSAQRLWLHDLSTRSAVILDDAATDGLGGRGDFLWWSTGDNEVLVWHVLDLRQLG